MAYSDIGASDVATPWFAERLCEQRRAHDGSTLRRWAETILPRLPSGALMLVSSSVEGCALAAAVAVLRDRETSWGQLSVGRAKPASGQSVVVVEPVLLGAGMLETLKVLLPGAVIIHGLAGDELAYASAA